MALSTETLAALADFFPDTTLRDVRLAVVPRVPGPPFSGLLRRLGIAAARAERILGITFDDTIVIAERAAAATIPSTLFHELVHVEQVRQLGLTEFVRRYARGWMEGGYRSIPLERDAYELQRRFEKAPGEPFDVASEVARRLTSA